MLKLLYNTVVLSLLKFFFSIVGLINPKVKKGLKDRKKLFENLIIDLADIDRSKKMIWIHSASMGEFEQAKPIIELLKKNMDVNIVASFFSPSGYINSKNYPKVNAVTYIPFDTTQNAKRFLSLICPDIAIMMRYDIWPNHIFELHRKNIPTLIVDATMKENTLRALPVIRSFHRLIYASVTKILTISEKDTENFGLFNISGARIETVGDTRFDRVSNKSKTVSSKRLFVEGMFNGKKVFVIGSSWEADEHVLIPAFLKLLERDKDVVVILVPHEPTINRLENLENKLNRSFNTIRFSYMNSYNNERIILVDSIGILLTLYYYADLAYVGGSFKQGIHNVLEPAIYGVPVIYGPKIENSQEAIALSEDEGGFIVHNKKQAYRIIRKLFSDENFRKRTGGKAKEFVISKTGASEKIYSKIKSYT